MVIDKAPKTIKAPHSESPYPQGGEWSVEEMAVLPEVSSDEEDEKNDSSHSDDNQCSDPIQTSDQESPRQRFPSTDSSDISVSTAHTADKRYYDKDAGRQSADAGGRANMQSEKNAFRKNQPEMRSKKYLLSLLVFLAIIFIAFFAYTYLGAGNLAQPIDEESLIRAERLERIKNFKSTIRDIKIQFPHQNRRTWGDIEAGMIDVINQSQKLWIAILFSNETKELSCLANLLGKANSGALHSEGSLELHPDDMGNDYGLAIDRLGPQINARKAVVVHDLLNIDPRAIQVFHTICDRFNPLVEGTAYVLTIVTPGNFSGSERPEKYIENQLTNRFIDKVPEDKLQPLITRLTDGPIIAVKPETSLSGCLEDSR